MGYIHPWYGPCDSLGPEGQCVECMNLSVPKLYAAADLVVKTFEKDEAQGYRSKDRSFAIDILKPVLDHATEYQRLNFGPDLP